MIRTEVWKNIIGLENYFISNNGRVKGSELKTKFGNQTKIYPERFINPWISKTDYNYIDITEGGKKHRFLLQRIVAIHFIENSNNLPQVNHKDGDKSNNHDWNLEWCTAEYNLKHARDLGLNNSIGCKNKMAKFNEEQIQFIRSSALSKSTIAKFFSVSEATISQIINHKTYKNVV